ncbi:NACHT domain-containing protein [Massilia sp. CT11-108]|uniref:NACHT domain-containing protein n=1 Tax=Massilia sp. CT11-108 TaxID=3393900 RepID=UPI0039A5C849
MAAVLPNAPTVPPIKGDETRQAIASLGGYVYQVYASCAAWLLLDAQAELHLEVADDYADVLGQSLLATQVKCTATTSVTIVSSAARATIDSFVYLNTNNAHYKVKVQLLTTSEVGLERDKTDQVAGRPTLEAWRDAAANRLSPTDLDELIRVVMAQDLKPATKSYLSNRTPQQLQAELFSNIIWLTGQPDPETLRKQCLDLLITQVHEFFKVTPQDAEKAFPAVLQKVLDTAHASTARKLTRADLLKVLGEQFTVTLRRDIFENLMRALAAQEAISASGDGALIDLQARSEAFAREVDIAGMDAAGKPMRLSSGLFVPREQGEGLLQDLRRPMKDAMERLFVVVGDGGHGKSSLLWWVYRELRDDLQWSPLFLPAASFAKATVGSGLDVDGLEDACAAIHRGGKMALILIDTADLLLRDPDNAGLFAGRLAGLLEANAYVVLSTRPGELERIDMARFTPRIYRLKTYSDTELISALTSYARRHGYSQAELDRILRAVAMWRPLKDVCAIPLAMRMLFDIYSPHGIPEDINLFELYREYWQYRIRSDRRSTGLLTDAVPKNGRDCSRVAAYLALQMLVEGTLDLEYRQVITLFSAVDGKIELVSDLLHRGILQRSGKHIHFFHQTLFEYAAAQGLVVLLGRDGIDLLSQRCDERPEDLFMKPIQQHALLLAEEVGGAVAKAAHRELDRLLHSTDLADQSVALHVHCSMRKACTERANKVQALLLDPASSEALRVHFLRTATNIPSKRLNELIALARPLWLAASPRIRQHMVQMFGRLASRMPADVLALIGSLRLRDHVFDAANVRNDVVTDYIYLLGNLALSAQPTSHGALSLLGDALDKALAKFTRLDCAAQVVSIVGQLDTTAINSFLKAQQPRHKYWNASACKAGADTFTKPYARLWAGHWIASGTTLGQLLASAPTTDGAELAVHLFGVDEYIRRQLAGNMVHDLPALQSHMTGLDKPLRILWARFVLGPMLGRAYQAPATRQPALLALQSALDLGIGVLRRKQGHVELGVAVQLLEAAVLSAQSTAALFGAVQPGVALGEWTGTSELMPFLLAASEGGLPGARVAYEAVLGDPTKYSRAASTLQARLIAAFRDNPQPKYIDALLDLVTHTGQAAWLRELLPELSDASRTNEAFRESLEKKVRVIVRSASTRASKSVLQLLPELVTADAVHVPAMDEVFTWLDKLPDTETRLHLAAWTADVICRNAADAARLVVWLNEHVFPALRAARVNRFQKEQYLNACAALVRRRLLDPLEFVDEPSRTTWADRLLDITLKAPALENHLTSYGWTIAAAATRSGTDAAALFCKLIGSPTVQNISQSAQRDLSRRLTPALRQVFAHADEADRAKLLAFAKGSKPHLVRSVIQIALECNVAALNDNLERLRTDSGFDADLRELIARFWRHHPNLAAMPDWTALQTMLENSASPSAYGSN